MRSVGSERRAERDGLANDAGIASELPLPQRVAEHNHERPPTLVVLFSNHPPQQRSHSQRPEKTAGHQPRSPLLRLAPARVIERQLYDAADFGE